MSGVACGVSGAWPEEAKEGCWEPRAAGAGCV